jgi:hypothetical protein
MFIGGQVGSFSKVTSLSLLFPTECLPSTALVPPLAGPWHPGESQQILALATREGGEAGVDILNPPRQGVGEGDAQGRLVQDGA